MFRIGAKAQSALAPKVVVKRQRTRFYGRNRYV
jgi:hypothetical protein